MKLFLIIGSLFFFLHHTHAQITTVDEADSVYHVVQQSKPDINRVHSLLELSTFYLHKTFFPVEELESALELVMQAEVLSRQLNYEKGKEDAALLKGKVLIRQEKSDQVLAMLSSLSDTNQIKLMIEVGKGQLRPTYTRDADWNRALEIFQLAEKFSDSIQHQGLKEESLRLQGSTHILQGDWPKGKSYFRQVIEFRQNDEDIRGEMKAWLRLATVKFCDDCNENIEALSNALMLAQRIRDRPCEALILLEIGYKYLLDDDGVTVRPERYALQSLGIQKKIGVKAISQISHALADAGVYNLSSDYGYLFNANYLLSDIGQVNGDMNQKLFYILEVAKSMDRSKKPKDLDYAYYRLGNAYWELGQYDKSMHYYEQSLEKSHEKGEAFVRVSLIRRMVTAMLQQGQPNKALHVLQDATHNFRYLTYEDKFYIAQSFGACYEALNQFALAEQYYLDGVKWSKQTNTQFQYFVWETISQFFVSTGQYSKATPYLNRLLTASPDQIIPSHLINVYLMRFKVDSAQANYSSAIKYYQQYKALSDSVFNENKSNQIEQLSIQYETEKKEQELKLKEKDITLLTQLSQTQAVQRNSLVVGTCLLIALLLVVYNRYRLKQNSNRHLKTQQHELQTQKREIDFKNEHLSQLVSEKDILLQQKDSLLLEKDQLLVEKEWLLKEVHHRVKNNLQIVMSLLNSQVVYLNNDAAIQAIRDSQHRVQAISLIHKKLYQSESVSSIDMPAYINELVKYLRDLFNTGRRIRFVCQHDPVKLNVSHAVPLGLILNEAITNGIKFAFPNNREGLIHISLHKKGDNQFLMTIRDNGVGLPPNFENRPRKSLGMSLMIGLSKDIGGSFEIENDSGTLIQVSFVYKQNPTKKQTTGKQPEVSDQPSQK